MNKNPVNAILENLRINEANSIDLGGDKSAYKYNGKYYIKSGDTKKEISAKQYDELRSKSGQSSKFTEHEMHKDVGSCFDLGGNPDYDKAEDLLKNKYKNNKAFKTMLYRALNQGD